MSASLTAAEKVARGFDDALSHPTQTGRHARLLEGYLTAPADVRDTIFAEAAYRLSACEEAITDPATASTDPRTAVPSRRHSRVLVSLSRTVAAALRAARPQQRCGS